MMRTTAFMAGRHRLVVALLALALAVGAFATAGFGPDWVTAEVRANKGGECC